MKESNAEKAGCKKGDRIVKVDSLHTPFYNDFQLAVKNKADKKLQLTVLRNSKDTITLPVQVNKEGKIGVCIPNSALKKWDSLLKQRNTRLLESIPVGL